MKNFHERYQRLARGPFGYSSLWLGEDHLVYVKGSGLFMVTAEEYKRFRLSEVEAMNLAMTSRAGLIILFLSGFLVSAAIASLMLVFSEGLQLGSVIFISFFVLTALASLGLLLRHLVLGPTCVCDLQTRLTRERIRPLNRYHHALEVVKRIDGLVRERQTGIVVGAPEVSNPGTDGARGDGFFSVPKMAPATFGVFLTFAILALGGLHLEIPMLTGAVLFLVLIASLLAILALVATVRRPTPDSIRRILWVLLVLHFFVIAIGSVYYLVAAMREPAYTVGLTGPLEAYTAVASEGGLVLYGVFVGLFLGILGASVSGLFLSMRWSARIHQAATLARTPETVDSPNPGPES